MLFAVSRGGFLNSQGLGNRNEFLREKSVPFYIISLGPGTRSEHHIRMHVFYSALDNK